MAGQGKSKAQDDRGVTPVIGGVVAVAVAIVLGVAGAQAFLKFSEPVPRATIAGFSSAFEQSFTTNVSGGSLYILPIAGAPLRLADGLILLELDGQNVQLPLSAIAPHTRDGALWRAGEEVCFVGDAPGCLRPLADTATVTITADNQLLFRGTFHFRAFEILSSGGVRAKCDGPALIYVVGADITYGANGPQIPVRLNWTADNGTTTAPLFGLQPIKAGMSFVPNVREGAVLGIRANANYSNFHQSYRSWVSDPHVKVLKDGDAAPNVPAFGNQTSVEVFLQPYVDTATRTMTLAYNEVIYLVEFNPSLSSPAADFQDAVVLLRFSGGCAA